MKCSNCGKEIIEPSQFCPDCGSAISYEVANQNPLVEKRRKRTIVFIVIAAILFVGIIGFILFVPIHDSQPSNLDVQQIINMCKEIPYNELLRNPSSHKGDMVHFSGVISTLMHESENGQEYLVTLNDSSDYIYFTFNASDGSRLLEGDEVEIYGEFTGLNTYTTLFVIEETVPSVNGWYVKWQGM